MTKEEALKILRKDSLSNLVDYYSSEELQDAIDTIVYQPSLPTNLDEAADAYSENILANGEDMFDAIADGFRAGAEWMAGQGESVTATVVKYNDSKILSYDQEFAPVVQRLNYGDKVVVQIRKK